MRKGFTLIELLIVVSIIGILAVALVPSISDAPARARDATRKAEVNKIVAAAERYNIDVGKYPDGTICLGGEVEGDETAFIDGYLNGEAPTSLKVPDSKPCTGEGVDAEVSYYWYEKEGTGYSVYTPVETTGTDIDLGGEVADTGVNYFKISR